MQQDKKDRNRSQVSQSSVSYSSVVTFENGAQKAGALFSYASRLHLRSDLHLARKVWHMGMGLFIAFLYMAGVPRITAVVLLSCFLGLDLILETARLHIPALNEKIMRHCGVLMRSSEATRMSGTPYYIASAILAIGIFPKMIAVLAIVYLACGDPIASVFGILYGDKGPRFANGKSWIGTGAGMVTCFLTSLIFLRVFGVESSLILPLSLIGGVAGGMAELLPIEVDDNFSIPVVSGFVLWMAFIVLGV
jgi:dolichol kinase